MFSWVACKALTGEVITELPNVSVDMVRQTLGRYETASAVLPIAAADAPAEWERATLEGGTFWVLLSDAADASGNVTSVPVWGALVTQAPRDEGDTVPVTLSTLEAYLDRVYISATKSYAATDQNSIVSDLVMSFCSSAVNGLPFRVQVVGSAGVVRDRNYADQDDKTVYSALQDLMGVQGGPEWFIGWEHQSNPERFTPVLYVGTRIGFAAAGVPNVTFEMPGPVTAFQQFRDFSDGKGANVVMAVSSGQGTVRPQSPRQVFVDPDRPRFEYRWTPSTSITDVNTLVGWAQSALTSMEAGALSLSLSASVTDPGCPQLGSDWFLGDDVGFDVVAASFPGGVSGWARAIGYQLTLSSTPIVTPVLSGGVSVRGSTSVSGVSMIRPNPLTPSAHLTPDPALALQGA